jgi:hypothetical protein
MSDEQGRAEMSVDLNLFCDPERRAQGSDLSVPFSLNGHTYASNGHIALRVPRRADIPDNKEAPNAERLPWDFSRIKFGPLPEPELLPDQCWMCEGRGHKHRCPDCCCECESCDGSGKLPPRVRIGKAVFFAPYIERIQALPGLEIGKPKPAHPLPFRFKGGEGLLMPQRPHDPPRQTRHFEAK